MIEAWGRGIEKMQADCKAHGVPGPTLRYEATGLWVEFENRIPAEDTGETTEKGSEKTITGEVTGEVLKLLLVINGKMARREMQAVLGLKGEDNFRQLRNEETTSFDFTLPPGSSFHTSRSLLRPVPACLA